MNDAENSFMQALEELQDNLTAEDNSETKGIYGLMLYGDGYNRPCNMKNL